MSAPRRSTRREWLLDRATRASRGAPASRGSDGLLTQDRPASGRRRVAPRDELVNVLEFEAEAAGVLAPDLARLVGGGDRAAFERMTFRPRMMVPCLDLDLSLDLFGATLFAPIVVGPVTDQRRFHAEGERATVRGAAAGKAAVIVSARSSEPIEAIATSASTPLFYQVFIEDGLATNRAKAQAAVAAGLTAVFVTAGASDARTRRPARPDWAPLQDLARAVSVPVVAKGVTTTASALEAVSRGAAGVVVSTYGRPEASGGPAPIDQVASIVDALGGRVPVLVDGGFRRGTDIMKALAFGASAVLVARPILWGLAAYGADGVQSVVELLQTELARVMACCGTPTLRTITRAAVKVHKDAPNDASTPQ